MEEIKIRSSFEFVEKENHLYDIKDDLKDPAREDVKTIAEKAVLIAKALVKITNDIAEKVTDKHYIAAARACREIALRLNGITSNWKDAKLSDERIEVATIALQLQQNALSLSRDKKQEKQFKIDLIYRYKELARALMQKAIQIERITTNYDPSILEAIGWAKKAIHYLEEALKLINELEDITANKVQEIQQIRHFCYDYIGGRLIYYIINNRTTIDENFFKKYIFPAIDYAKEAKSIAEHYVEDKLDDSIRQLAVAYQQAAHAYADMTDQIKDMTLAEKEKKLRKMIENIEYARTIIRAAKEIGNVIKTKKEIVTFCIIFYGKLVENILAQRDNAAPQKKLGLAQYALKAAKLANMRLQEFAEDPKEFHFYSRVKQNLAICHSRIAATYDFHKGDFPNALEHAKKATVYNKDSGSLDPSFFSYENQLQGQIFLQERKYEEAITYFTHALENLSVDKVAYKPLVHMLAETYLQRGTEQDKLNNSAVAEVDYRKSRELSASIDDKRKEGIAVFCLAYVALKKKDFKKASELFQESASLIIPALVREFNFDKANLEQRLDAAKAKYDQGQYEPASLAYAGAVDEIIKLGKAEHEKRAQTSMQTTKRPQSGDSFSPVGQFEKAKRLKTGKGDKEEVKEESADEEQRYQSNFS